MHSALKMITCGVVCALVARIPVCAGGVDAVRVLAFRVENQFALAIGRQIQPITQVWDQSHQSIQFLEGLEKENRILASKLVESQTNATASAVKVSESNVETVLSFSAGQWILLRGQADRIAVGAVVLREGTYLGRVTSVSSGYSTILPIVSNETTLLVQHAHSGVMGILTVTNGRARVQFSDLISTLTVHDLVASVPDGTHTRLAYPVGEVTAIVSAPSDSTSTVELQLFGQTRLGAVVNVLETK